MDFTFEFNGDTQSWSIPGSSQDLFHLFLPLDNSKKLFRSFWICSIPVFRIEQCMDQQSNNILPWPLIKSALERLKKGRLPHWYTWLKLHYTPTISIDPIITRRLWISTTNSPTFDKCKKEWIYFLDNNRTLSIEHINSKLVSNNLLVITHWSETQQQFKFTPCKKIKK